MATFLFIMIVLALLALVVTLVVFTLSQRKKARLQNPHDSYHGRYRSYPDFKGTSTAFPAPQSDSFHGGGYSVVLQYPDTIKRRFGRRIGQPTGISQQPLRPPPPLRNPAAAKRPPASRHSRSVPTPSAPLPYRPTMRTQRVRPREPAETTPQTAKKRPQGENYKFATKSPPTFVP